MENEKKGNTSGRKKLDDDVIKSHRKTLRFTINELQKLSEEYNKKKSGLNITFTEFLKDKLLRNPVVYRNISEKELLMIKEINKIGTNINQMSKRLNEDINREIEVKALQNFKEVILEISKKLIP